MPDPIKKQIADKLIALLEAWTPFYDAILESKAGRVSNQATDGWLRTLIARPPADFPRIAITNGRFTHSGFTQSMTYAGESDSFATAGHWLVDRRLEFKLTITARDLKSTSIDPAEEEAQNAILNGGPRLHLPTLVKSWGPITADQYPVDAVGQRVLRGGIRLESELIIPVNTEQDGQDIV